MAEKTAKLSSSDVPLVTGDHSRVTDAIKADLWQAIAQIEGLPADSAKFVHEVALRAAVSRDLHEMAKALQSVGLQRERAIFLCRWLRNRAKALMTRDERIKLGLFEAIWVYSGAPCMYDPTDEKSKCRDEAHRLAQGRKFNVADGLRLNEKNTWPGYEPDCKCSSKVVLPF
ncbi:hypothetical protein [Pseudomonas syringae]|uniref:hypothetical protein n=1 Tax=Pseudomonas syringae TaxID=317 RepID=UPI00200B6BC9|nr:hypothetical protein [Pseudomonas syringae]MCK9744147.1 hypothetical protein [Pseudomonas syringae pv. syringae]MCK9769623.1 hypothetical protein [Pseudomonas syringae pv. syringae]